MYNILNESLIRINTSSKGPAEASLPLVYAALMADEVDAFPSLRPHQRHAWHAFLVQLGAMAVHRAGLDTPPSGSEDWLRIIRGLTPDWPDDEPWQLVVEDITKPAFFQSPASSQGQKKEYKNVVATPDELDMLVTSRNHSLKNGVLNDGNIDDWLFALVNMQTMDGRPGNGYYGISRMNSNDGSRTAFSLTPSLRWGQHVLRDIDFLIKADFSNWPMRWDGISLIWIKEWDGKKSEALRLDELHPYFLEICRRCRLRANGVGLQAIKAANAKGGGCRIAAEQNRGNVGDPWTLVNEDAKGLKALTMQKDSFSYRNIATYLFSPDWKLPILFDSRDAQNGLDSYLVARGLRRKQGGQTEGYYERIIPLRAKSIQIFGRLGGPRELSVISNERIEQIRCIKDALRHAIATFASDGKSSNIKPENWSCANPGVNELDHVIDKSYFEDLQNEFDAETEQRDHIRNEWLRGLADSAHQILRNATASLACRRIHRHKAHVQAEDVFWSRVRGSNGIPDAFNQPQEDSEWQNNVQQETEQNPTATQITPFQ